jgi:LysM repeat protein
MGSLSRAGRRSSSISVSPTLSYAELVGAQESTQAPQSRITRKKINDVGSSGAMMDELINKPSAQAQSFHIVKPQDNLYRISLMHNLKISKLLEWNNIEDVSTLKLGSKLWLIDPSTLPAN